MARLRIVRMLRGTLGATAEDIARLLCVPRASVRRLVSELRAGGVTIHYAHGFYSLQE